MKLKKKIKIESSQPIIKEQPEINTDDKEIIITSQYIDNIIKKIEQKTQLKAIKQFLKVFRFIVNEDLENQENQAENNKNRMKSFLQIKDSNVYTKIMTFAFQSFPKTLNNIIENQKKNRKTEIIFKVFVTNFFKFMNTTTEDKIKILCLKSLNLFIHQILPFKSIYKKYSKFVIEEWSTGDTIQVKLHAFIVLQKICKNLNQNDLEMILRKIYLSYVKNTKQTNLRNHQLIQFMINCFKELLSINPQISYYIGFSYIRQIAIHLKMGFREKSQENIFMIYNWQYLNTIKLWSVCVLNQDMEQLAYPLIQIVYGMLELFYTENYFPLYLHLIQTINSLCQNQEIITNIWKFLIKMLNCQNFRQRRKTVTARHYDFQLNIKIQNKYLKVNSFWNDLFTEIINTLMLSLSSQSNKIYFPEISIFVLKDLKKLKKNYSFNQYKIKIQHLIRLIEQRSEIVKNNRIEMCPKNFTKVIDGDNQIQIESNQIQNQKVLSMKEKIDNQDEQEDFSAQDEEPIQEKEKKTKKSKKIEKQQVKQQILESSEASEFVDEGPDENMFENDELLSDLEESLEGDPDQELSDDEYSEQ